MPIEFYIDPVISKKIQRNMKKILLATTILTSIAANSALAKTEGNYIGVDFLSVRTSFYTKAQLVHDGWNAYKPTQYGSTYGAGLHYGYAFNANNFFIMPTLFVEQTSFNKTETKGTNEDALKVRNRYGLKADIGYDIGEVVSPYLTLGYSAVSYKSTSNNYDSDRNILIAINSGTASGAIYGGGLRFAFTKNISMNVGYTHQKFIARSAVPQASTFNVTRYRQVGKINTVTAGLSYNF